MDFKKDIGNECAFHITKTSTFCSSSDIVYKINEVTGTMSLDVLKDKYKCETEECVLTHPKIIEAVGHDSIMKTIADRFRPTGPRESNEWFSNNDIDSVLNQIQQKYVDKHFLHVQFQMIDFEKTQSELAILDMPTKYKENYRTFGTVLNTDVSTGRGKHWFALFGQFLDNSDVFTIEYFNSSGELPMDQVAMWIKRVKHEWQPFFQKQIIDVVATRIVNQKDNWNCGAYSLYYIISRLDGTPYQYFANNAIGDDNMQEFRKFLFRPN